MATPNFLFNPDGKKTILSIDGGGMRGVIPLQILIYLEQQTGKPAYELFDFIGGTSTGAIIGTGLALGHSAEEIMKLVYRDALPKAFGKRGIAFWLRYIFGGMKVFYPLKPFVEALRPFAADKRIHDLDKAGVLLTVKDLRTSNTYYVTNRGPGANTFRDWTVVGAVAASSAAPPFFPAVLGNLIDGGVGVFANPCLATSIEAIEYIGYNPADTIHISLGTGFVPHKIKDGAGSRFWLLDWVQYIILESIDDAAWQQAYNNYLLYRQMDFRRYNPSLTPDSVQDALGVNTHGIDPLKLGLDSVDTASLDLMQAIGQSYAEKLDWSASRVMPWSTTGGRPHPTIKSVDWSGTMFQ